MTKSRGIGRGGPPGDDHPRARLTTVKVQEMRRMVAAGGTIRQAADWAGVAYKTTQNAVTGVTWAHVEDPPPVHRLERWSAADLETLRQHPDDIAPVIAAQLKRTARAVRQQRSKRGL